MITSTLQPGNLGRDQKNELGRGACHGSLWLTE